MAQKMGNTTTFVALICATCRNPPPASLPMRERMLIVARVIGLHQMLIVAKVIGLGELLVK